MITELKIAYDSGKAALEIAKGVLALQSGTAINSAVIEIQGKLLESQSAIFEANEAYAARLNEIDDLKKEVMSLKAWDGETERYELKRYYPGTIAYALKPSMAKGEPPHRLCASCYQKRAKSILQHAGVPTKLGKSVFICNLCKSEYLIGSEMEPDAED